MWNQDEDSAAQQDLVICADQNSLDNNRWQFTDDPVDYRTVQVWNYRQLHTINPNLKRAKICGLSYKPTADLLERLCAVTRLEQLEFDTLEFLSNTKNEYSFDFLKSFSVDAVNLVEKYEPDSSKWSKLIRLCNTPYNGGPKQFEHLYFGSNSLEYFDPRILQVPVKRIGFARKCETLYNWTAAPKVAEILFEELLRVECRTNFQHCLIKNLVGNQDIRTFRFNLIKLTSTTYQPDVLPLKYLEHFYSHLRRTISDYAVPRDKPISRYRGETKFFINGVRLKFGKLKFEDYCFDLPLANVHLHNSSQNQLELDACSSVTEVKWMDLIALELELFNEIKMSSQPSPAESLESLEVEPLEVDPLYVEKQRFVGLMRLYPNLRVVIVENMEPKSIKQRSFLAFLSVCRALTELKLVDAGLPTAFYDCLAKVASLANLHRFTLLEPFGFTGVRTHFAFLNSQHLRYLHTNLATPDVMKKNVLERMQPLAEYKFQFWDIKDMPKYYYYQFQKLDANRWDMLVEEEYFHQSNSRSAIIGEIGTAEDLLIAFEQPQHSVLTSHWLDDLDDLDAESDEDVKATTCSLT